MSISFDKLRQMSPKQLLLLAVELSERLDRAEVREPIAIVGMACRFPGADSPDEYWRLLSEGRDATSDTPADRWDADALHDPDPDALGRIVSRRAGYLRDVAGFDASLFGISPREALTMDPQQRLLLETAWEALERAGQAPDGLHGQSVGVFVGLCNIDHFHRLAAHGRERIDAYLATGNAPSVAAGRLSYCFGFKGPAITIDTACSSSLVSLHLATQSLRSGECRMALAGGVNVICAPEVAIALSRGRMLAPDGRSKAFDAAADGFARGEGCGLVALKRFSDAQADGDRIIAVIRGSAVNQDGRSGGITAPNGPSQEAVIRAALRDASLAPSDVDYVEAHGTGTPLGDPIEVRALGGAFGFGRKHPLVIGSAKTNIGHLESAAGVAGVIKTALAIDAGVIPKSLHFKTPSPHIAWEEANVVVAADTMAWPQAEAPRRAGVSSFGFSGTNAHVVLEQAPASEPASAIANERPVHILPLSAHNAATLRRLAAAYEQALAGGADLAALAHAAGVGRARLTHRAAVIARDVTEARSALAALAADTPHPGLRRGEVSANNRADVVFLFSGQGGQDPGMGRALYAHAAKFRETIDLCADIIGDGPDGLRLQDVLFVEAGDSAIHRTEWTQPAMFAFQHALVAQWRAWGVEPAAVLGHSLGEFAAACAAGVFSFEAGLHLTAARGRLCAAMPPGAMVSIFAPKADVAALVSRQPDRVGIAAINGPDNVVISGAPDVVMSITAALEARGLRSQVLRIDMPAHSPLVEGSLEGFEAEAGKVSMQAPRIPVAWNVTGGEPLPGDGAPDAGYWRTHMRATVRFADGLQSLERDGFTRFLEIGPHATLTALAAPILSEATVLAASLRRDCDDWQEIATAVAQLFVGGVNIDWRGWDEGRRRAHVAAPTYPFDRRQYWIETARLNPREGADQPRTIRLSTRERSYLADHVVGDRIIVSASSQIEAIAGVRGALRLRDCAFLEAIEVRPEGVVLERVAETPNVHALHKLSRDGADAVCARARFEPPAGFNDRRINLSALQARLSTADPVAHYEALAGKGVRFGAAFRRIVSAWRGGGEALARIDWRLPLAPDAAFDPASLDAAFQTISLAAADHAPLRLVSTIDTLEIDPSPAGPCFAHAQLRLPAGDPDQVFADVTLCDADGTIFGAIEGVSLRAVAPARDEWCYALAWRQIETTTVAIPHFVLPTALARPLEVAWEAAAAEHRIREYDTILATLDDLSVAYAGCALSALGFDDTPGRIAGLAEEAARLGIPAERARTFEAVLKVSGACAIDGDGVRVKRRMESIDPEPRCDALLADFAPANGELRLLRRCGGNLAEVLRGAVDPTSLLFPNGGFDDLRLVYEQSASARAHNTALAATLRTALSAVPADARVRVLEIGAGTCATTSQVLGALAGREIAYTLTDVSPLFLERAKERFSDTSIEYRVLDIETAPASQGFAEGGYDIVIAANVLHATRDIADAARHARALLAPGGLMLALEGVHDDAWVELTFGLTDGWRRYTDTDLRKASPLIGRTAWRDVLAASGFDDVIVSRDHAEHGRAGGQQALIVARAAASPRSFRIAAAADNPLATAIATELESRGHRVTDRADFDAELVYLANLTADPADELIAVHGALARSRSHAWIATHGAWPVEGVVSPQGRSQSTAWGIGRAFAVEVPDRMGALVDLDPRAADADSARHLADAILRGGMEDQIAIRGNRTFVARLTPSGIPQAADFVPRADAAYLVTGGFGGLGPHVGRWLAERGARHVVMLGRKPNEADPRLHAIRQAGATVHVLAADVADAVSLRAAIARFVSMGRRIAGVFHAAASFSTAPFASLTDDQIAQMVAPKIGGALALESVLAEADLDFIVHFSSTTALLGAAGFAHYAGANAFLDATAQSRVSRPHILTVNWGTWSEMRGVSQEAGDAYRRAGLRPMEPTRALDLMGRAIAARLPALAIADIDWSRMKALHETRRARPFLTEIVGDQLGDTPAAASNARLLQQIGSASPAQRMELLTAFVRSEVSGVLGSSPDDPPSLDLGLFEMGMDSLMSLELKRRLEQGIGHALPATLTFNYPNVRALSGYLDIVVASSSPAQPTLATDDTGHLDALTDDEVEARLLSLIEST